jgi:hypothetical protein
MAGEAANLSPSRRAGDVRRPPDRARAEHGLEADEREKRDESKVPLHVNHLLMEVTDPRSGSPQRA